MATKRQQAKDEGREGAYTVLSRVQHDGEHYEPGEPITLDAVSAKALLDVGAIEPVKT